MESNERMEEVTRENAIIIWQASRLSIGMKCEKAPEILKANGTVVGTLGNFSASIGKAKSKKTFNVSAIVAAALKNGTVLLYSAELPKDKRKILYVDTEQSPYHCLKVMERILRMAGLPTDRDSEHLEFLALRKYTPKERIAAVEQAIYNTPELGVTRDRRHPRHGVRHQQPRRIHTHHLQADAVDGRPPDTYPHNTAPEQG